jgi:nucleoside-diphosphate-sugar epimerase
MQVFVCGSELGIGFVVAKRLLDEGHEVTMLTSFEDLIPNLTKNKMNPVLGDVHDAAVQQQIEKADAVIDVDLPFTFPARRIPVASLRPSILKQALEGSGRPLIITSSAAVLGDTGTVPLGEKSRVRPLRGFAWLARLEKEILQASDMRSIVIRPAWEIHGSRPARPIVLGLVRLAKRFRRGKFIESGDNAYSAVHFDDLAALYCVALKKAGARTILHGASENVTPKQLAGAIHCGMGFKGDPSSLSFEEAKRYIPIAEELTRSHALSGDLARTLGWRPSQTSILNEVEQHAAEIAFASRHKQSRTECRTK